MEKSFKNLKMMAWSDRWPEAVSVSNSNPEPFTVAELCSLTGTDFSTIAIEHLDYQSAVGDAELRHIMCSQWYLNSASQDIMLTAGAQEALFIAFNALVQAGDHVVCFTPAFEPLTLMPEQLGAQVTRLPLLPGWLIDMDALELALKKHAKLLVLNFPHNPTGAHISESMLLQILELCQRHQVFVLSDEVFRGLEHNPADRLPAVADIYPQAISLGVMSKAFALPAIRLGWILCQNKSVYEHMLAIKNHLSICVSSLDVTFTKQVLPFDTLLWKKRVDLINQNKALLERRLQHQTEFSYQAATASATCFIEHKDSKKWAEELAYQKHIKVLPNHCFETQQPGFRLSLGIKDFQAYLDKIWPQSH